MISSIFRQIMPVQSTVRRALQAYYRAHSSPPRDIEAVVAASSAAEGRPLALAERSSCTEHLRQERQAERFAAGGALAADADHTYTHLREIGGAK